MDTEFSDVTAPYLYQKDRHTILVCLFETNETLLEYILIYAMTFNVCFSPPTLGNSYCINCYVVLIYFQSK